MNEFHQTFIKKPVSKENTPTETKKKIEFQSSEPYPPINCSIKNSMYARIMLDNMAGNRSEMSAISLYTVSYTHLKLPLLICCLGFMMLWAAVSKLTV